MWLSQYENYSLVIDLVFEILHDLLSKCYLNVTLQAITKTTHILIHLASTETTHLHWLMSTQQLIWPS